MRVDSKSSKNVTFIRTKNINSEATRDPEKMEAEMGKTPLHTNSAEPFQQTSEAASRSKCSSSQHSHWGWPQDTDSRLLTSIARRPKISHASSKTVWSLVPMGLNRKPILLLDLRFQDCCFFFLVIWIYTPISFLFRYSLITCFECIFDLASMTTLENKKMTWNRRVTQITSLASSFQKRRLLTQNWGTGYQVCMDCWVLREHRMILPGLRPGLRTSASQGLLSSLCWAPMHTAAAPPTQVSW